jgi:O-antigen ligase
MHRFKASNTLQLIIFAVFIGLIGLSPSLKIIPQALTAMSLHDSQRMVELLLISLLLIESIIYRKNTFYLPMDKSIRYALSALTALAITSSCLAISPRHALIEISLFAGLLYLTLFVARLYHENRMQLIKRLTYVVWGGILLSMAAFYVGYLTATIFKTPVVWPAPITGFNNVRFFNQYQLWTLGLTALPLLSFDFNNTRTRYWLHLGMICWWVLLFHTASRGVLLSWGLGILVTAAVYRKLAWPLIRLQLIHFSTGFLSYQILFELIPFLRGSAVVTGTIVRDTTSDRIELWKQALHLIQNHPIFGIGPMHFAWYSPISAHPHNSVLQIMTEWGLPAALLILIITCYALFCWLKKFNVGNLQTKTNHDCNLAIILFFTFISNAIYSLVDGVIVMPISQVMMFTFIGLMIGYYHQGNITEITESKIKSLIKALFAGIVLATLIWSTLPEILQNAADSDKRFSMGYTAMGPRFWLEFKP